MLLNTDYKKLISLPQVEPIKKRPRHLNHLLKNEFKKEAEESKDI